MFPAVRMTLVLVIASLLAASTQAQHVPTAGKNNALDRYVAQPDDSYRWEIVRESSVNGHQTYVVDLVSQSWLTADEVDRTQWQHWLSIVRPPTLRNDTALLFISGGRNGGEPPAAADAQLYHVAAATGSIVAELRMVPNQPLIFHGDGERRVEDDLIGYTWDQFLNTGDERWPARMAMVKSAVRAMDTVQAVAQAKEFEVNDFVVAGASKRGWTTWITGAVDKRVSGLVPIVIDVLNTDVSMQHHYAAYGFWAPAIKDYVNHKITHRRNWPNYRKLMDLVDPLAYRERLTMPKLLINATGDEFFLPDSSQFYFDQLVGEKHLCYVPNSNHSLRDTNALESLIAFHFAVAEGKPRPALDWKYRDAATLEVSSRPVPGRVLLWKASNPETRDFRVDTIGRAYQSQELQPNEDGLYVATLEQPEKGWTAYFVQAEYDIGAAAPLRLTTPVRVIPETLPYADKESPTLPLPN